LDLLTSSLEDEEEEEESEEEEDFKMLLLTLVGDRASGSSLLEAVTSVVVVSEASALELETTLRSLDLDFLLLIFLTTVSVVLLLSRRVLIGSENRPAGLLSRVVMGVEGMDSSLESSSSNPLKVGNLPSVAAGTGVERASNGSALVPVPLFSV
jgi:hypothetical protein